jgi:hypothetical protein
MNPKTALIGGMLAAVLLAPGIASAGFVLDTGAPTSTSGGLYELTTNGWYAAEFTLSTTENISSLSTYMEPLSSTSFQFDIYSSTNFTTTRVTSLSALESTTASYTAAGWNTANVNYTLGPGTYWVALEITSSAGRNGTGIDLATTGISTSSGTAPAQAFAYYGSSTNSLFTTSNAPGIALQIEATPVPLPGAIWLLGSGLAGLGALRRRRLG